MRWLLLALLCLPLGCATLVRGTRQPVRVECSPADATIRSGGTTAGPDGVLQLERTRSHRVVVEREGYQPARILIHRELSWWLATNVVNLGVGALADLAFGGAYDLEPRVISVELERQ